MTTEITLSLDIRNNPTPATSQEAGALTRAALLAWAGLPIGSTPRKIMAFQVDYYSKAGEVRQLGKALFSEPGIDSAEAQQNLLNAMAAETTARANAVALFDSYTSGEALLAQA